MQGFQEVTDVTIVHLAQKLGKDKLKLIKLGLQLGVPQCEIDSSFTNHKEDVTMAAHSILCAWMRNIQNRHTAWYTLGEALRGVGLKAVAADTLNYS